MSQNAKIALNFLPDFSHKKMTEYLYVYTTVENDDRHRCRHYRIETNLSFKYEILTLVNPLGKDLIFFVSIRIPEISKTFELSTLIFTFKLPLSVSKPF